MFTEAGLYDIHYIVAQFLQLIYQVHKNRAYGVVVLMIIHRRDVLGLQLLAHFVDVVLNAEGLVDVVVGAVAMHGGLHLCEGIVAEHHEGFQLAGLILRERFPRFLFAIERLGIDDDLLVVAADNLLFFSFQGFVDYAREKGTSCIMCHEQQDEEKLRRTGVIVVDEQMKVLEMQEKPEHPKTTWAVPPFYVYLKKDLPLIKDALNNGCGKDAPGNLAHYLAEKTVLHAWKMPGGRFDIGSLDTYYEAVERFGSKTLDFRR